MKTYGNKNVSIGITPHGKFQVSICGLFGNHEFKHQGDVECAYVNNMGINVKFFGQEGVAFLGKLPTHTFFEICYEIATLKNKSVVYDGKSLVTFK